MSTKTKAQLLAENEALQKRMAELLAVQPESHQKNDINKKLAFVLNERDKELNCIRDISRLVKTTGISLTEILQGSVEFIPTACQYPKITCARIMHEDQEYKTENFYESKWKLTSEINISGERVGSVEVFYLEKRPKEHEMDERVLIDALAERFGSIIQLVQSKEREQHLNLVLRSIRNVNQLINSEKKPDILIQKACDIFIETRGFSTVWIALVDASGKFLTAAESGLGKDFTPFLRQLKHNILPACSHLAQPQTDVVVLTDPETTCRDCPLITSVTTYRIMTRLEHSGTIYGYLSISTPVDYALDEEEQSLLREIAGDIAFGLYNIELEEKREQADQKLQENFEYQKSIFETTFVATAIIEEDTTIAMVNKEFEKLSGYPKEDLEGKMRWTKFVAPDDMERMKEYHRQRRIDPDTAIKQYEFRFINKASNIRNVLANVDLIQGTKKSVASLLDITEAKQALELIQQERVKAQNYLNIAEVMIVALNKKGEITLVNQKGAGILGYKIEELIGKNWYDTCVPEEYRKQLKKIFDEFMTGEVGLGDHFEQTVLTKSGEKRIIDWHSIPLWDGEKNRIGSLSSGEDITERKRAESLLNALNKASVAMGAALTQEEIFTSVAEELEQLDISCMLFPLDEAQGRLFTEFMSYKSAALKVAEKLVGIKREGFSFPIDTVDVYRKVVRDKKTLFIDNSEQIIQQICESPVIMSP